MPNPKGHAQSLKSFAKLPDGYRNTRSLRIALPDRFADLWDTMTKEERSSMVEQALEQREATQSPKT